MGIILSYDGDHIFRPWSTLKLLTISDGGTKLTMDFYDWLVEIEGESLASLLPLIQGSVNAAQHANVTLGSSSTSKLAAPLRVLMVQKQLHLRIRQSINPNGTAW